MPAAPGNEISGSSPPPCESDDLEVMVLDTRGGAVPHRPHHITPQPSSENLDAGEDTSSPSPHQGTSASTEDQQEDQIAATTVRELKIALRQTEMQIRIASGLEYELLKRTKLLLQRRESLTRQSRILKSKVAMIEQRQGRLIQKPDGAEGRHHHRQVAEERRSNSTRTSTEGTRSPSHASPAA